MVLSNFYLNRYYTLSSAVDQFYSSCTEEVVLILILNYTDRALLLL